MHDGVSGSPLARLRWATELLGVAVDASSAERRTAYLEGIKAHPPDRDPEAFEAIRDAYAALEDPKLVQFALLVGDVDPAEPLERFLDDPTCQQRRFVGPSPWLAVLSPWQRQRR